MKDRVVQFGPELNLVGILSGPAKDDARPDFPAVLMLNAGLLHRVGPHRMSVSLAHRLSECGIRSLRFDMGGYGDSEVSTDAGSTEDRTISDIKSAMDFLEREHDIHRFVLFGTCSGADNSHEVALRDPRVAGAVLLDAYGYWTPRSYVNYYLPRVFRAQTWINRVRRILYGSGEAPRNRVSPLQQLREPFGPRSRVEREIQSLVDRGAQFLYIYSGGVEDYYNYAGQFFDQFKGLDPRGNIEVDYYPNADHTYTFADDRERMFQRVVVWCRSRTWNAK